VKNKILCFYNLKQITNIHLDVFFHISCLTSSSTSSTIIKDDFQSPPKSLSSQIQSPESLKCFCIDTPQVGSIQNLMEQIKDSIRKSTTEMSLSECSESYFSVNINLGERKESNNLQFHNNIVKYVLQSFSSVTVHLEGEVYQNTTIEFHDVIGELILKASLDFQQFPETYFYPATPSIPTTLTLVFKNVNKVIVSYLMVKNYDSKSKIVVDARKSELFSVKKVKFSNIENLVYANRCRSEDKDVPCDEVLNTTKSTDYSIQIIIAIILSITAIAILIIFYKDGFRGSQLPEPRRTNCWNC